MKLTQTVVVEDGDEFEQTDIELVGSRNSRGFGCFEFLDRYHQECSLQDSSLATEPAIWFGVDNTGPNLDGPNGNKNEKVQVRMHLTQAMVKTLLPHLQRFAETGNYLELDKAVEV
jgi:hypothetical protein